MLAWSHLQRTFTLRYDNVSLTLSFGTAAENGNMPQGKSRRIPMNFTSMQRRDVPQGRSGKHKAIVTKILSDLDQITPGDAIRVALDDLPGGMENVRSAINRATRKLGRRVATSSDDRFLYIWNESSGN